MNDFLNLINGLDLTNFIVFILGISLFVYVFGSMLQSLIRKPEKEEPPKEDTTFLDPTVAAILRKKHGID